jgi:GTP-binding protein
VCGSKADVATSDVLAEAKGNMSVISAVTGLGMAGLVARLAELVTRARASEVEADETIGRPPASAATAVADSEVFVHRPLGESPVEITRGPDGTFLVGGRQALRAVALSDLTDDDALDLVQGRLRRLGVERALVRAGVRDGDQVQVGDLAFTYHPDDLQPGGAGAEDPPSRRKRRTDAKRSGRSGRGS